MPGGRAMTAAEYIAAIRAIIASDDIPEEERIKRVDALKCQRLFTLKEYAFEKGVNYRTVRRWAKAGKVSLVDTPAGKRIVSSLVL
jgi:DNA invertase Pin-like site-specific DNA recombinase